MVNLFMEAAHNGIVEVHARGVKIPTLGLRLTIPFY